MIKWYIWPDDEPDSPDRACQVGPYWAEVIKGDRSMDWEWAWEVYNNSSEPETFLGGGTAYDKAAAQAAAEAFIDALMEARCDPGRRCR